MPGSSKTDLLSLSDTRADLARRGNCGFGFKATSTSCSTIRAYAMQRGDTIGRSRLSRGQLQMLPRLSAIGITIKRHRLSGPDLGRGGPPRSPPPDRRGALCVICIPASAAGRDARGDDFPITDHPGRARLASDFHAGEADTLRRALSRDHMTRLYRALHARGGEEGIAPDVAADIFAQLASFAGFGFNKSHAASFALITYQTMWLKRYQPLAFFCALLSNQPIGFYPAEVIVGEARRQASERLGSPASTTAAGAINSKTARSG